MKSWCALLALLLIVPAPAEGYLQLSFFNGTEEVRARWHGVPRWFVTDRGTRDVAPGAFQATFARAFANWQNVRTASIAFDFAGFTGAEPFDDDGLSVIGFVDAPELDRTLGATSFTVDIITGEIVEADIFINSAFPWSTAASGDPARFDLESIALHEIGHFLGLGHSAIGETTQLPGGSGRRVVGSGAVMFPIASGRGNTADRILQPDDIAGVSDLYPDGDFRAETGAARGRVLRGTRGVVGAHVIAFNPETGALVGGMTLNEEGEFEIAGLSPGPYVIRVEPLDDADPGSFFSNAPLDLDFQVTYYERLFVAPAGGVGERFTVSVPPR